MKKLFVFALAHAFAAGAFWAGQPAPSELPVINFYWSGSFCAPQNFEGGADGLARESTYSFAQGIKLNWDALDFRIFNSCKKTSGADFCSIKNFGDWEEIFCNRRASIAFDFSKKQKILKTKIALGSLRLYSQKRLAPFSAAASPFVASLGDAGGLCASLPTRTSSVQPGCFYGSVSLEFPKEYSSGAIRVMPLRAEFAVSKNDEDPDRAPWTASFRGGFFYMNYFKATAGVMFSRYYCSEQGKADVDWFAEIPTAKSSLFNSAAADISLEIPFVKSKTTFGAAESQSSLGRATFAQEFLFSIKRFSLAAAFFASDNIFAGTATPYVAANAKEYKKVWQAKITPQIEFKAKKGAALKIGLGGFVEEQIKDWGKKAERRSLEAKAAAGIRLSAKNDLFKLAASLGAVTLRQIPSQQKEPPLPKISASAYWSHSFSGVAGRLSLNGGASFQPELDWQKREWTERLKVAWHPRGLVLQSLSAGFSASQKDGKNKFEPSASAAFLFRLKTLRFNASVSAAFPFGW